MSNNEELWEKHKRIPLLLYYRLWDLEKFRVFHPLFKSWIGFKALKISEFFSYASLDARLERHETWRFIFQKVGVSPVYYKKGSSTNE